MDDKLSSVLRSLPRERARPGFTGRVLRRLEDAERRPESRAGAFRWPWMAAAVAAGLVLFAVGSRGSGPRQWWHQQQQQQQLSRLATLESERRALLVELESLQRQMADARPLVYLGGSNDVDLVLDLERLRRSEYRFPGPSSTPTLNAETPSGRSPSDRSPGVQTASFDPSRSTIY